VFNVTTKTTFGGRVFAVASEDVSKHPYQTQLRFVFTDFAPNANKQGVSRDEIPNLVSTAQYMPVKVNFDGELVYGHKGSIPVGPILNMREEDGVLVADAVLWRDEFPELAAYLEKASASDGTGSVNFSWELYYKDSTVDDAGNEWLSGTTVAAATIVDNPAYRGRTHLIAIAEESAVLARVESVETLIQQILTEFKELRSTSMTDVSNTSDEGAQDVNVVDTEFTSVPTTEFTALSDELATLRAFKADVERKASEAETLKTRRELLDSAGIASADLTDVQTAFILGMSAEQFSTYLETTKDLVKKAGKSSAESKDDRGVIPDPSSNAGSDTLSISTLAQRLRSSRRAEAAS
jgi:hypothetical protein